MNDERAGTAGALHAHAGDCEICREHPLPMARLADALHAVEVHVEPAAWSAGAMRRLGPELLRLARRAYWRQLAVAIAGALLPLPFVLAYDAYILQALYAAVSAILPAGLAAYMVFTDAMFLLLLFAATYAAIPVLLARQASRDRYA